MNILFFTEISPFPINGGQKIRTYGLLKALSQLGHHVEAIIYNFDRVNLEDYTIDNVNYTEYRPQNLTNFERISGNFYFKKNKSLLNLFDRLIQKQLPDFVFLDYGFIGQYISFFKKKNIPVVYGTHNAQSDLTKQEPRSGLLKKVRKKQLVMFEQLHEKKYFKLADLLIAVSEQDKYFHSHFISPYKIHVIPNFLDESLYNKDFIKQDYFVMTANFGVYMNQMGLRWLIKDVWNNEINSRYVLKLVGRRSKEFLNSITEAKKYENIIALGEVDNILPYIGEAKAVLVPLLHGSGSRLKCLEAMALKTPIISTSKGAEGIISEHLIIADAPEKFRSGILNLEPLNVLTENLYNDFMENYSLRANKHRLKLLIDSIQL